MRQRIITGIILVAILIPIFIINELFPVLYVLMVLLVGLGALEMLLMYNKREKIAPFLIILTVAMTVFLYMAVVFTSNQIVLPRYDKYMFDLGLNVVILMISFVLLTAIVFAKNNTFVTLGHAITTTVYVGVSFASIMILRMMGVRFIIYLFLITMLTDMFAYFFGIKYGKHKMAPYLSPKKSYEGAIAGSVLATIIASLFALFFDIYPASVNPDGLTTIFTNISKIGAHTRLNQAFIVVPLTFLATIVSQIGDIVASKFKRTYDIKDFGSIFPGHGGVIDRFDSAMFTGIFLVLFFTVVKLLFPL